MTPRNSVRLEVLPRLRSNYNGGEEPSVDQLGTSFRSQSRHHLFNTSQTWIVAHRATAEVWRVHLQYLIKTFGTALCGIERLFHDTSAAYSHVFEPLISTTKQIISFLYVEGGHISFERRMACGASDVHVTHKNSVLRSSMCQTGPTQSRGILACNAACDTNPLRTVFACGIALDISRMYPQAAN